MESPMTSVFNLSELMVGGFGVSDRRRRDQRRLGL
jgi:hypothetical protein